MKTFLKLILLLFFFGLTLDQNSNVSSIEEKWNLDENELVVDEDSGMYHLMNFHRIEYSVLENTERFSVRQKNNLKENQPIVVGKVIAY